MGKRLVNLVAGIFLVAVIILAVGLASYTHTAIFCSRGRVYFVRVTPDPKSTNRMSVNFNRAVDDGSARLEISQRIGGPAEMSVSDHPPEAKPTWAAPGLRFWDAALFKFSVPAQTVYAARVQLLIVRIEWILAAALFWPGVVLVQRLLLRARTLRRRRAGQCPACGYDLRGSLGRCPECGAQRLAAMHA